MASTEVKRTTQVIGSDASADIVLTGRYVSDRHAMLIQEEDQILIEDLDSTYGVHVNGQQISKQTVLLPADRVKIGTQLFHWKDHIDTGEPEEETNPIYLKDLILPSGLVSWRDYKIILLIALGAIIVVPIGVPTTLYFLEHKLGLVHDGITDSSITFTYSKSVIWALGILGGYILLNLTQKVVRDAFKNED